MSLDYMTTLMLKAGHQLFGRWDEEEFVESRAHITRWGQWRLRPDNYYGGYELVFKGTVTGEDIGGKYSYRTEYNINLDRCRDAAAVADWIFQVNGKRWATPKVVKDFVSALEEILNPQANVCTRGCAEFETKREGRALELSIEEVRELAAVRLGEIPPPEIRPEWPVDYRAPIKARA